MNGPMPQTEAEEISKSETKRTESSDQYQPHQMNCQSRVLPKEKSTRDEPKRRSCTKVATNRQGSSSAGRGAGVVQCARGRAAAGRGAAAEGTEAPASSTDGTAAGTASTHHQAANRNPRITTPLDFH